MLSVVSSAADGVASHLEDQAAYGRSSDSRFLVEQLEAIVLFFFFFKQKTAYEMSLRDWVQTCALPILLVRAKTRDIAILRTMGASRRGMMKVFMTVGVTIGSLGIVLGIILGAVFLFFRQNVVNAIQIVTGQNLWGPQ